MAVGVKYALQPLIDVFSSSSKVKKLSSFSIYDISIVLSLGDTNDERIEEAVDELQERRLQG